jgi:hypothetical protein
MNSRFVTFGLVCLLLGGILASAGWAQGLFAFTRGNEWRTYPDVAQLTYLTGFVDALGLVDLSVREGNILQFGTSVSKDINCLTERKIPVGQLHEVVKKWMRDHPENWDFRMSIILLASIQQTC